VEEARDRRVKASLRILMGKKRRAAVRKGFALGIAVLKATYIKLSVISRIQGKRLRDVQLIGAVEERSLTSSSNRGYSTA